jgi:hypothetical protein
VPEHQNSGTLYEQESEVGHQHKISAQFINVTLGLMVTIALTLRMDLNFSAR